MASAYIDTLGAQKDTLKCAADSVLRLLTHLIFDHHDKARQQSRLSPGYWLNNHRSSTAMAALQSSQSSKMTVMEPVDLRYGIGSEMGIRRQQVGLGGRGNSQDSVAHLPHHYPT